MDSREHWEQVYSNRAENEVSWYQEEPEISLAIIERTRLGAEDPVIDVGGGASVLADRLVQLGHRDVSVLDISETSMVKSRARLRATASAIKWITADIRQFRAERQYALWHDRSLFHFMVRASDRRDYVTALHHALGEGGHLVLAAFAIDGPKKCSGLDIARYDASTLQRELGAGFELLDQEQEVHCTPSGNPQRFGYYHFRKA